MQDLLDQILGNQMFASLIFIAGVIGFRFVSNRWLDSRVRMETDLRRRVKSNIKNGLFFIVLIALIFIWAPSLRTFALSLTAFAVAIILATKELILCFSGYVLKSTGGMIRVGDWIEVGDIRGEVVDQNIMTTTLEELGKGTKKYEFTGRTLILPNSQFLTSAVKNERFNKHVTFHSFDIVVKPEVPSAPLRLHLLEVAEEAIKEHQDVTRRYKAVVEKRSGIRLSDHAAECLVNFMNDANVKISVTCFVPVQAAQEVEAKVKDQAVEYIANWYAAKKG